MEPNLHHKDALQQARCLLSRIAAQTQKKNDQITEEPSNDKTLTEETLISCMAMAQSFHSMNTGGLSVSDCSVIRAIIELIVRWGIYPRLSPGVGIPRKWKPSQTLTLKNMTTKDEGLLLKSCKMLASFAMGSNNADFSSNGFCVSLIVRNYYLVDVMAGFLQVAFGPAENDEKMRNMAACEIEEMMAAMEVGEMVETFLTLVGGGQSKEDRDFIPSPPWLTSHAGKFLSTLVMKEGGVAAVMQNLLGPGVKGDVQVYNNVAAHLAKVPKYIANHDLYYQAVCAQILPFLSYQNPDKKQSGKGENVQQVLRNMHHTSLLLACNMIVREPGLSKTYILKPILVHLVKWYKLQTVKSFPDSDNSWNEGKEQEVTETLILQSFMQLHALLTAGHNDSNKVKKEVLEKTRSVFPVLMMLHYLLETSATSKPFWDRDFYKETELGPRKMKQADKQELNKNEEKVNEKVKKTKTSLKEKREKSAGFKRGFLDGYVSQASDEEEDCSALGSLKVIITDFIIAHISEFSEDSTHLMLSFLFDLNVEKFTWPSTGGDIWSALKPNISRLHTPAEYLARLLLACEKWSLVVKLVDDIFWKVFNLRKLFKIQLLHEVNNGDFSPLTSVLNMVQSLETLNEVVGSKAFECDLGAAAKFVQDLLLEPTLLNDEDMVELVLHMVHSVLNGFDSRFSGGCLEKHAKETLTCMSASLERICSSQSSSQNLKRMSSTLNTRICSFVVS